MNPFVKDLPLSDRFLVLDAIAQATIAAMRWSETKDAINTQRLYEFLCATLTDTDMSAFPGNETEYPHLEDFFQMFVKNARDC